MTQQFCFSFKLLNTCFHTQNNRSTLHIHISYTVGIGYMVGLVHGIKLRSGSHTMKHRVTVTLEPGLLPVVTNSHQLVL